MTPPATTDKGSEFEAERVSAAVPNETTGGVGGASVTVLPPEPVHGLDVDNNSDADSAVDGVEDFSSTASVRSSVYDYIEENGRRYHRFKEGQYLLPNDESEQERLDIQHNLMLLALDGKLHVAPIENMPGGLHNVLDIATGTGNWAIDFANAYPTTSVVGTDLSPIQPEYLPPNCRFEIDDAEDDWLFPVPFDYIHGRALITCFRSHHTVFTHAFNSLRSGGYLELQDCDLPLRFIDDSGNGTALGTWSQRLMAGGAALGKDLTRGRRYKEILEEIGFVDVVEKRTQFPIGTWAMGRKNKTLGAWMRHDMLTGLQAMSMAIMTRGLGMASEEVDGHLVDVNAEIESNRVHAYYSIVLVYARKP
ncbi:S-adenosyl-L-methionine-dependent methyltransferase [Hyaloscypha bicolor E]|uniref:S-adenosyl-L-methionine-dependent methyltransferase n=1 Tax=Hyaloscypha bicolor E TaxID=1095630 RepID=A0A2J6TJ64_9HELO|nr:S-adenosyl-L-methionine-dependent methyltransferase [Hyaloscypha bicolor E]PMD63054.1 S-adenosyl-L-methionine-dependent methyltransferase [Hyaloscypha bicolor E]